MKCLDSKLETNPLSKYLMFTTIYSYACQVLGEKSEILDACWVSPSHELWPWSINSGFFEFLV